MNRLPSDYDPHRDDKFDKSLIKTLKNTEHMPGSFTIGRYAQVVYTDGDPTIEDNVKEVSFKNLRGINDQARIERMQAHSNEYFARAKRYIIANRKANVIGSALHFTDLKPPHYTTLTDQTIAILPDLINAQEIQDIEPYADIAHLTLRRAFDYNPDQAQQIFENIATSCRYHRDQMSGGDIPYLDKYITIMTSWLQRAAAGVRHSGKDQDRSLSWRYNLNRPHSEQNLHSAITAFDNAGFITPQFWQGLLAIPLSSQSFSVAHLLADKLKSSAAPSIVENIKGEDRSRIVGGVLAAAMHRAYQHPARDQSTLHIIQKAIQPHRHQPDILSVDKAVSLANKTIQQRFSKEFSSLRQDEAFSDVGQALSFLLKLSIKSDAAPEQIQLANEEAAIYIDIIQGIVEHTQLPVIRTIGDLALRYANASPDELEYLQRAFHIGGIKRSDALRRKQRRGERRDNIQKPGYGKMS